jgi:hypothetical protein
VGIPVHRHRGLCGEPVYQAQAGGELEGLVYGATPLPKEEPVPFYKNEWTWAGLVVVIFRGAQHSVLVAIARFFREREKGKGHAWFRNSHLVFHWSAAGRYGAMIFGYGVYEWHTGSYPANWCS